MQQGVCPLGKGQEWRGKCEKRTNGGRQDIKSGVSVNREQAIHHLDVRKMLTT
jgi:hypothetical protein